MSEHFLQSVARVRSCYPEKFGVPRQAGLSPSSTAELIFEPAFRRPEAVHGLEGFSHLWLSFLFHQVDESQTRLSVRPPRLGGNDKRGVFSTRSPFRPNRLGLSAVRLQGIDFSRPDGPVLLLSGVDLVDGTPVLDVKPYLPYADCLPEAKGGSASSPPALLEVAVSPSCRTCFETLPNLSQRLIRETLALDPRPLYRSSEDERLYHTRLEALTVTWQVTSEGVEILAIQEE